MVTNPNLDEIISKKANLEKEFSKMLVDVSKEEKSYINKIPEAVKGVVEDLKTFNKHTPASSLNAPSQATTAKTYSNTHSRKT